MWNVGLKRFPFFGHPIGQCRQDTGISRGGGLALIAGIRRMIDAAKGAGYILNIVMVTPPKN
jgi:hypothetical protein